MMFFEGWRVLGGGRRGWMAVPKKGEGWVQKLERRPLDPPLGPRLALGEGTLKRRPLDPPLGPRLGLGGGVQGLRCRGGRW